MSKKNTIVNSPYFDLSLCMEESSVEMVMHLKTPFQTTKALPHTHDMLHECLPGVLCTRCYNKENLPFKEKVKDTNIAHLFEHILLEYLREEKLRTGAEHVSYRGVTSWDWRDGKDPKGMYRIKVTISRDETMVLKNALRKAIELVERLLNGLQPVPVPAPAYTT